MIARKLILPAIAFAAISTMAAQDSEPASDAPVDQTQVADDEAAAGIAEEPTEEPAAETPETKEPETEAPPADDATEDNAAEPAGENHPPQEQARPEILEEAPPAESAPGLAVRVEKLQSGNQVIDPAQVRVLAPFPAKLLARSPDGWRIEPSESAPHFTREVELAPGKHISLTVRPHVLVPDADGSAVFSIPEPGYSAPLGYRQDATVGAILSTSIRQLDKDAGELGDAIEQLQQLLVSLPKTEEVSSTPDKQPVNKRQR